MRLAPVIVLALLVTACAPDPIAPNDSAASSNAVASVPAPVASNAVTQTAPATADPGLAVEAEGLRLFDPASGSARPLPFGTARAELLAALAFRGPPGTGTNGECGAGPLDYASWPDGLTLYFQSGAFTGWALDERAAGALTTASGIGPGSTRAALDDAYAVTTTVSSIGTEFAAGELYGVLDGEGDAAKITNMWAGVSCVFR